MAATAQHRLLGPNHNKLVIIDDIGEETHTSGHVSRSAAAQLLGLGWRPYSGPAEAKAGGWVVPGTDPRITPRSSFKPV